MRPQEGVRLGRFDCRYYSGVTVRRTTSTAALVAMLLAIAPPAPARAQPAERFEPSFLLPVDPAWTLSLGSSPRHGPAFDGELAFLALRNDDLVAVDLLTGRRLWTVEQRLDQPPAAGDDVIVAASGGRLDARRATDGSLLWSTELEAAIVVPPLWNTGWLVVATAAGRIVVLRGFDGAELWRRDVNSTPTVRPAIAGNRLFVPLVDGRIVVLALGTGSVIWERELRGRPQGVLPLDALYVGSTDNHLYRLASEDGAIHWGWRTGGDIIGTPAADVDHVYFNARDNVLRALDRRNGARRWRRPLAGRPADGPIRIDSIVVTAGISPTVELFDAETGVPRGSYLASTELAAMPHVIPDARPPAPHIVLVTRTGAIIGLTAGVGPTQLSLELPPEPFLPRPLAVSLADLVDWFPLHRPGRPAPAAGAPSRSGSAGRVPLPGVPGSAGPSR